MNIYVSHSRNFDYQNELYTPLRQSELNTTHTLILPHEDSESPFPTKELFESQQCDIIFAEVSHSATGQGIELGWADLLHIPVICFSKHGAKISGSLYIISNKFVEYMDSKDMVQKLTTILALFEQTKI